MGLDVEMAVYIDWDGDGFTAGDLVTSDVRNGAIILGITDPKGRVAEVGELTLTLDNSERQYTPGNITGPHYGKILPKLAVLVTATVSAATIVLFTGIVVDFNLQSQRYGDRFVDVVCNDRMRDYQDNNDLALPLRENTTADELLKLIDANTYESGVATGEVYIQGDPAGGDGGDTVTVGEVVYTFKNTPASAFEVDTDGGRYTAADFHDAALNLAAAINNADGLGTYYNSATTRHPQVTAVGHPGVGWSPSNYDTDFNLGDNVDNITDLAWWLSFGAPGSGEPNTLLIKRVYLYIAKVGTPDDLVLTVETNAGGPSGILVDANATLTITAADVGTSLALVAFDFPGEFLLEASVGPWWRFHTDQAPSATDYWIIGADSGYAATGRWNIKYKTGGTWTWPASVTAPIWWIPGRVVISADSHGTWGNGVALADTGSGIEVSGATLSGGAQPSFGTHYDTGVQNIEYAGDTWRDGVNAMTAVEDILKSEYGYYAINRAGEPVLKNTHFWFLAASAAALDLDNVQQQLSTRYSLEDIKNQVAVSFRTRRNLGSMTVARATEPIAVPGTTSNNPRWSTHERRQKGNVRTVSLPYTDPNTGEYIGAVHVDALIPGTHYSVNDVKDGSGYDYSTQSVLALSWAVAGAQIELTFANKATGTLYVIDLYVTAQGLSTFDQQSITVQDDTSIAAYGKRLAEPYDLPLPVGEAFAQVLAAHLVEIQKDPALRVDAAVYEAVAEIAVSHLLTVELFDAVAVSDYQTALSAKKHLVTGIEYDFDAESVMAVTFHLQEVSAFTYWQLGEAGYSELGVTTILGL